MANKVLDRLSPQHRVALDWFDARAGEEISWPEPLDGMFLMQRAKGIHKPKELNFVLSVRQSIGGPYDDSLKWPAVGEWTLSYAQEGSDPNYFTNRALVRCFKEGVPVGVVIQIGQAPLPRYRILGLGIVVGYDAGVFAIEPFGDDARRAEVAVAVSAPIGTFDASNLEDARKRDLRALAIRQGQPAFRRVLLEAYGRRCAITGCAIEAVLEAAHIIPYLGEHTNHVQNGLLLRSDLHTLLDQGQISFDPDTYLIQLSSRLRNSEYVEYAGKALRLPVNEGHRPAREALLSLRNAETGKFSGRRPGAKFGVEKDEADF